MWLGTAISLKLCLLRSTSLASTTLSRIFKSSTLASKLHATCLSCYFIVAKAISKIGIKSGKRNSSTDSLTGRALHRNRRGSCPVRAFRSLKHNCEDHKHCNCFHPQFTCMIFHILITLHKKKCCTNPSDHSSMFQLDLCRYSPWHCELRRSVAPNYLKRSYPISLLLFVSKFRDSGLLNQTMEFCIHALSFRQIVLWRPSIFVSPRIF